MATDALGNVVGRMAATGLPIARHSYGPFGEQGAAETDSVGEGNALRFKARERDADMGLYSMRAR